MKMGEGLYENRGKAGVLVGKSKLMRRREAVGWLFILPWFIGFVLLFIQPMANFFVYSFTNFSFEGEGYVLKPLENGIWEHYIHALTGDAEFPRLIVEAFEQLLYQVPVIVFFSLFVATILNQKFRGRMIMRTIFFLPIIVTAGVVSEIIQSDMSSIVTLPSAGASNIFDVTMLTEFLLESGFPQGMVDMLTGMIANVADLVWKSGIQILIFMAALLSIPPSFYEVAQVEGASGWETFWKITFPTVSPFVLATIVYTIIDSFTSYDNQAMRYIRDYFMKDMNYSYAAAMAWLYFLLVLVVLGIVLLLCRRMVPRKER